MKIDEKQLLILQYNYERDKWEDITKRVQWFDDSGNACRIKYAGNSSFYWKSWRDIEIFKNPKSVDISGKIVYYDEVPEYGLSAVVVFDSYAKLFYSNGFSKLVKNKYLQIVSDITETREVKDFIGYLKEVAALMPAKEGHVFFVRTVK